MRRLYRIGLLHDSTGVSKLLVAQTRTDCYIFSVCVLQKTLLAPPTLNQKNPPNPRKNHPPAKQKKGLPKTNDVNAIILGTVEVIVARAVVAVCGTIGRV